MSEVVPKRVVFTGGGTGGHLYPLLAVAEEFRERYPLVEVVFIGSERGTEARVVPKEGYPLRILEIEAVMGRPIHKKMRALYRVYRAVRRCYRELEELRPEVVVGSGGYVSVPATVSAWLLGVPVVILEQNAVPGWANRFLGMISDAVCVTHQETMKYFPRRKVHLTGNPVSRKVLMGSRRSGLKIFSLREELFTVLVFGGSSGAHAINRAMTEALQWLLDLREEIQFLHQTGDRDYEFVREAYQRYGFRGTVTPYIYQMPEAYAVADLVVCRAGATTIAELCVTGRPSILIPYPHATGDHQLRNAERLQAMGASVVIRQEELTGQVLADEIKRLYRDEGLRGQMGSRARAGARLDAAERVVDIAVSLIKRVSETEGLKHTLTVTDGGGDV